MNLFFPFIAMNIKLHHSSKWTEEPLLTEQHLINVQVSFISLGCRCADDKNSIKCDLSIEYKNIINHIYIIKLRWEVSFLEKKRTLIKIAMCCKHCARYLSWLLSHLSTKLLLSGWIWNKENYWLLLDTHPHTISHQSLWWKLEFNSIWNIREGPFLD